MGGRKRKKAEDENNITLVNWNRGRMAKTEDGEKGKIANNLLENLSIIFTLSLYISACLAIAVNNNDVLWSRYLMNDAKR